MKQSAGDSATDWVIINAARGGRFECLRCGSYYAVKLPAPISIVTAAMGAFTKDHRRCKLSPEGLHCVHCGNRGHGTGAGGSCPEVAATKSVEAWLRGTDTGISSRTIYGVLKPDDGAFLYWDAGKPDGSPPRDGDDFGRCSRLLVIAPEWRARLPEVAARFPEWAPLVEHWDELEALYQEESPKGRCPRLYARMLELTNRGER